MTTEHQTPEPQNKAGDPDSPAQAPRKRHWAVSILWILGISYLVILIALVYMEPQLVYPGANLDLPAPNPVTQNAVTQYPAAHSQDWEYPSQDGTPIVGRLLDRPGSNRTVLYLHGNAVKAALLDDWISRLSRHLEANVLAAEYRGFQNESITPSEENVVQDALSAHDALCEHYQLRSEDLVVYGRSLGGGCAAAVASERNTRTLILDRTFDSVADVAANKFPIFPVRWLMQNQFDSVSRLGGFTGRLIQIHGTPDLVVPITHGKRLHDLVPSKHKVFLEIPGMYHNDRLPGNTLDQIRGLISDTETTNL